MSKIPRGKAAGSFKGAGFPLPRSNAMGSWKPFYGKFPPEYFFSDLLKGIWLLEEPFLLCPSFGLLFLDTFFFYEPLRYFREEG